MITCPYCQQHAKLVTGKEIYPHRPDLADKKFWQCHPCKAYVGCHGKNTGYSDGTRPLGRLANEELRIMKSKAHAAFDPLWKGKGLTRKQAYAWLAERLDIPPKETHIGEFDISRCQQTIRACNAALRAQGYTVAD